MTQYSRHIGQRISARGIACLLLACCLLLSMVHKVQADEREYKIEAVFLYNFFNYITWPGYHTPEDMKQATICIPGGDPIRPYLEYIQHKRAQERKLDIRQINDGIPLTECRIFFIREINDSAIAKLHSLTESDGILLVSTEPAFVDKGGMIGLVPEGERMAFEIDNSQLAHAHFQVSSRLLDLATRVK